MTFSRHHGASIGPSESGKSSGSLKLDQPSPEYTPESSPSESPTAAERIAYSTVMNAVLLYEAARDNWEEDASDEKTLKALDQTADVIQDLVSSLDLLDERGRKLLSECLAKYI